MPTSIKLRRATFGLLAAVWIALPCAAAATDTVPHAPLYSIPMATIVGRGLIPFKVTLGMLVNAKLDPVGVYRSYPSRSSTPLSEQFVLPMLARPAGAILASYRHVPLLVLHGRISTRVGDYPLTLSYLTGIAKREYAHCVIHVRYADGRWQLINSAGQVVSEVIVVSDAFGIHTVSACVPAVNSDWPKAVIPMPTHNSNDHR